MNTKNNQAESFIRYFAKRMDSLNATMVRVMIEFHDGERFIFLLPQTSEGLLTNITLKGETQALEDIHPGTWEAFNKMLFSEERAIMSVLSFNQNKNTALSMAVGFTGGKYNPVYLSEDQLYSAINSRVYPVDFVLAGGVFGH